MRDFMFMVHNHLTNESTPVKKSLRDAVSGSLHGFMHKLAVEVMIELDLNGGSHECAMTDELDGSSMILRNEHGHTVALLVAVEVEAFTARPELSDIDVMGGLLSMLGGVEVTAAGFDNLPDELKEVLRDLVHDENAPAELRQMLSEMIGEQKGAPSGETVH